MLSNFENLSGIARNFSAVCAACGAVAGGYVYLDMPLPATKSYVIAQNRELRSEVIDGRLQTNGIQRQLLRKEKFDRVLDVQKAENPNVRSVLQGRLDQIEDELSVVNAERERLEAEKRKQP